MFTVAVLGLAGITADADVAVVVDEVGTVCVHVAEVVGVVSRVCVAVVVGVVAGVAVGVCVAVVVGVVVTVLGVFDVLDVIDVLLLVDDVNATHPFSTRPCSRCTYLWSSLHVHLMPRLPLAEMVMLQSRALPSMFRRRSPL